MLLLLLIGGCGATSLERTPRFIDRSYAVPDDQVFWSVLGNQPRSRYSDDERGDLSFADTSDENGTLCPLYFEQGLSDDFALLTLPAGSLGFADHG